MVKTIGTQIITYVSVAFVFTIAFMRFAIKAGAKPMTAFWIFVGFILIAITGIMTHTEIIKQFDFVLKFREHRMRKNKQELPIKQANKSLAKYANKRDKNVIYFHEDYKKPNGRYVEQAVSIIYLADDGKQMRTLAIPESIFSWMESIAKSLKLKNLQKLSLYSAGDFFEFKDLKPILKEIDILEKEVKKIKLSKRIKLSDRKLFLKYSRLFKTLCKQAIKNKVGFSVSGI